MSHRACLDSTKEVWLVIWVWPFALAIFCYLSSLGRIVSPVYNVSSMTQALRDGVCSKLMGTDRTAGKGKLRLPLLGAHTSEVKCLPCTKRVCANIWDMPSCRHRVMPLPAASETWSLPLRNLKVGLSSCTKVSCW